MSFSENLEHFVSWFAQEKPQKAEFYCHKEQEDYCRNREQQRAEHEVKCPIG